MSHQTYDVEQKDGLFVVKSHNFPEFISEAHTEKQAVEQLSRMINYYADNSPQAFADRLRSRMNRRLECECGIPLKEKPLGIYLDKKSDALNKKFKKYKARS